MSLICWKVCIKLYLKKKERVFATDTVNDDTVMSLLNIVEGNESYRMELPRPREPECSS